MKQLVKGIISCQLNSVVMPFTIAHPAIVIPLRNSRLNLSLTGLVIGSMTPDLEFFFQMREVENIGHHWHGILLFDVPVAILFSFLFHNVLRNKLLDNLPEIIRKRFSRLRCFNWNAYFLEYKWKVFLSFLIGIGSHIFLDSFTHEGGFMVGSIPVLSSTVILLGTTMPFYLLLQIVLSLLGMVLVSFQVGRTQVSSLSGFGEKNRAYWYVFILLFLTIMSVRLTFWAEYNSFGGIAIATMGSIIYSWIAVSVLLTIFKK